MPTPKGGHEGRLMIAAPAGGALVTVTGLTDAEYNPGQNFTDGHGMDSSHGFDVSVKSKPEITLNRIDDKAQSTIWKAMRLTEAGTGVPFVFYPIGESADSDALTWAYLTGTAFVQTNSSQSLSDPIKGQVTLTPSDSDWSASGNWNPA